MNPPQSSRTITPFSTASALVLALAILSCLSCEGGCERYRSKTTFVSIGTGGTGGVYYPYGGGLAEIWSRHVPGIKAAAEVTGASVENVKLAHRGETVVGEIMGDVAYQAYHGEGKFTGEPQNILAMAVMYPNVFQLVTLESSGIETVRDIEGRIVSIGAPGSGTAFMSDLVLTGLGFGKESFRRRRLSFIESANAMKDRTIEAGIWCVAPPTSSIMDLATTHHIRVVPFDDEERERIFSKYPFYSSYELPGGLYRGVEEPVETISVWNVIICTADLPSDLVYMLTKVLFENNEYMKQIHPFAAFTTPENTVQHCPIPLHPGAIRYLQERGFTLSGEMIPNG